MARMAQQLVQANGLQDKVTILTGRVEDITLPNKMDIIISEWMGFYLLHESMLESVLIARDRFLRAQGRMLPCSARIWAALVEAEDLRLDMANYEDFLGLDLRLVGEQQLAARTAEPRVEEVHGRRILAEPLVAVDLTDLHQLRGYAAGIAFWFDVGFGRDVILKTDPGSPPTHWKQTVVYFGAFPAVESGDVLEANVVLKQSEENPRQYNISVETLLSLAWSLILIRGFATHKKVVGRGRDSPNGREFYAHSPLQKLKWEVGPQCSQGIGSYNIVASAAKARSPLDGPEYCKTSLGRKLPSTLVPVDMCSPGPHHTYEVRKPLDHHKPNYGKPSLSYGYRAPPPEDTDGKHDETYVGRMEKGESIEITTCSEEVSQDQREILQERQLINNPVKMCMRSCVDHINGVVDDAATPKKSKRPRKETSMLDKISKIVTILQWDQKRCLVPCRKHEKTARDSFRMSTSKDLTCHKVRADLVAGLTVGVMVIPQSMSYGAIAGLPYINGMYSACIPTLIYAFFGQSRQLAVGPVAMVSLLVEAGLNGQLGPECTVEGKPQYETCPQEYVGLACLTAAVVGVMQILASVLKLGFLVTFLGHPVISGFTSGAAIIIGLSQLKYILGFDLPKSQYIYETIYNVLIGVFHEFFAETYHVKYVGEIPSGIMPLSLDAWQLDKIPTVLGTAMSASR
eukprot:g29791.t1